MHRIIPKIAPCSIAKCFSNLSASGPETAFFPTFESFKKLVWGVVLLVGANAARALAEHAARRNHFAADLQHKGVRLG